ncbi:MAG: ATP synthase F1 subunit delta [Pseudomonadota bacterium]
MSTIMRIGTSHRRYAKALMAMNADPGDGRTLLAELRKVEAALKASSVLRDLLVSPLVDRGRKASLVKEIAEHLGLGRIATRAWDLVVQRGRSEELPGILWQLERLLDDAEGKARAEVRSTTPLDPAKRRRVKGALDLLSGRDVICEFSEDPALLGGLVARLGNQLFDGSIRGRLERLRRDWLGD